MEKNAPIAKVFFAVLLVMTSDFLIANGVAAGSSCKANYEPDIPLATATQDQVNEINQIHSRLFEVYFGATKPANLNDLIARAKSDYDALNIIATGSTISGGESITSIDDPKGILSKFVRYIKFEPQAPDVEEVKQNASNLVWLIAKKFCEGTLSRDYNAYNYKKFIRPTMYLGDMLPGNVKELVSYTLDVHSEGFKHVWSNASSGADYSTGDGYNTDWIYNMSDALINYATWLESDDEKVQWMKAMKRYLERFGTPSVAMSDGIKVDGSGFHHWTAYDNYMYAYKTAVSIIWSLQNTSFQIDKEAYLWFRDAVYYQAMISNNEHIRALSRSGRKPQARHVSVDLTAFGRLAIAGGQILGLTTADPLLAGYVNRIGENIPEFNYTSATPFEQGFFQANYAHTGIYRGNEWVATMKGFSSYMWGAELYVNANRFGRYQSYGTLEIIYPGDASANGFDVNAWNWNYNPGATTIVLPFNALHGEKGRIDELQQKRFVGALALGNKGSEALSKVHGTYGLFAMDFQEREHQGWSTHYGPNTHNGTFTFKKSTFAFSDMIVCLGSGISNNDKNNNTVTTLYQRTTNPNSSVIVNGTNYTSDYADSFTGDNHWILSDGGTGFYVVNGGTLNIWSGAETTPNQNQGATGWESNTAKSNSYGYLDHGSSPNNQEYEYICVPGTAAAAMTTLSVTMQSSGNQPYIVHQKDANAHIVEHKSDKIWGYALFTANNNVYSEGSALVGNSYPCLVMYREAAENSILLSVTNPDLGFDSRQVTGFSKEVNVRLTLDGDWSMAQPHPDASVISSNNAQTVLQFKTKDGLPIEVELDKVPGSGGAHHVLSAGSKKSLDKLAIYPNPADSYTSIVYKSAIPGESIVKIVDMHGRVVLNRSWKIVQGENKIDVDVQQLNPGFYILQFGLENDLSGKKLMIK